MAGMCIADGELTKEDSQNADLNELCDLLRKNKLLAASFENLTQGLHSLTVINLSNNELEILPEAVGGLLCLEVLNVGYNSLRTLPASISQLTKLRELHSLHNKISALPDSFAYLHELELLNLSCNEFSVVPSFLNVGCFKISHIDFSHNLLTEWTLIPKCVRSLQLLRVSYNRLQSNPAWLWGDLCHAIVELDLSNNDLINMNSVFIPNQIWRTGINVVLQELNLANCGLIPKCFSPINQLQSLRKLNVGNDPRYCVDWISPRKDVKKGPKNTLWELPLQPLSCKAVLTELNLCGVGLSMLPKEINVLRALEVLDCRENKLQWLPDSFCLLSCLRIVNLSKNDIVILPSDIGKLASLEELYVDNNKIDQLPESFSELKKLLWLDLYGNQLEEVPSVLDVLLPTVQGLDLGYNCFHVRSHFEEKTVSLSVDSYTTLRKNIRQRLGCDDDSVSPRSDDMQSLPHYSSQEDIDSVSSDEEYDSCSETEPDYGCSKQNDNVCDDDENWDLDADDDEFDPTCMLKPLPQKRPSQHELWISESIQGANTFCPADIHALPARRPSKDSIPHDNDQFEDA